ncbi:MAG: mechanosensitive ion channel family protein [Oscillatoriophycideae cyanobacterium NC_groundwater_1537_Pr4_S-0.65um_50_18]|nr:mechanosensitive ion channel family protein [Oscillatoriophycideae cyanobacterium NC_groundwater_1537_Pr4_S-0.65um_50_18]
MQKFRRFWQWLILGVLAFGLTAAPALGQLGPMSQLTLPSIQPSAIKLPRGVERSGTIETAPVNFENKILFRIAAPTVFNREEPKGQTLVEVRAEQIEANLQRIISVDPAWNAGAARSYNTLFDPESLQVQAATLNKQSILLAIDAYRSQPQGLLTVTDADARYYRLTIPELTQRWQQQLEAELTQALERRLPSAFARQTNRAIQIGVSGVVASLLLLLLQHFLTLRDRALQERQKNKQTDWITRAIANPNTAPSLEASSRLHFFVTLQNQFTLERRRGLIAFLSWLSFWLQVLIWLGGLVWILYLFPNTARWAEAIWSTPAALVLIWFGMGLANRLGDLLVTRFSQAWENSEFFLFEDNRRRDLRISTIVRSTKGLKTFLVYAVGLGWALSVLGAPTSSVLTFGAVAALAISLAAQGLIKDLVNGFLILCEDQYAIGDWIAVGTVDGLVENMNLRITQIRTTEGRLITIPNSLISQVENLTRSWSRVDFRVSVAYRTDVKLALSVVRQVAQHLYDDPEWQPLLLELPKVLGIETLSHEGMSIRVWIDTKPLQQWIVAREFRLRLRLAFEEYDIEIGAPQQVLWRGKTPNGVEAEDGVTGNGRS